jgi:hypothetical protein
MWPEYICYSGSTHCACIGNVSHQTSAKSSFDVESLERKDRPRLTQRHANVVYTATSQYTHRTVFENEESELRTWRCAVNSNFQFSGLKTFANIPASFLRNRNFWIRVNRETKLNGDSLKTYVPAWTVSRTNRQSQLNPIRIAWLDTLLPG